MDAEHLRLPSTVVAGGSGDLASIVLLHGFTQTGASWMPLLEGLRGLGRRVVTVDLPGHGSSDPALDSSDLATAASLVAATAGRAVYVGYSMGGRVALRLALDRPEEVEALVLIGATAGIVDTDERRARQSSDSALAERIEAIGAGRFVDEWLTGPLFRGLEPTPSDLAGRKANRPEGLAASLRNAGTSTMDPPWWDSLTAIEMPVLVLNGQRDPKFAQLGARLVETIGTNAVRVEIPGAGHAAHLEAPSETCAAIGAWLAGLG